MPFLEMSCIYIQCKDIHKTLEFIYFNSLDLKKSRVDNI